MEVLIQVSDQITISGSMPTHHVPMFVPYPFRPFWQPNSLPASPSTLNQDAQLERLSQKLDTAEKKIDEYLRLIVSLYAELKRHQDIICLPCKEKILRASALLSNASGFSQSASQPIAAAPDSFRAVPLLSSPSLVAHDQTSPVSQSARVDSPAARGSSNLDGLIFGPDTPQSTSPSLPPTTTAVVSPYSADLDSEPPQLAVPSSPSENATAGSIQPDWSVEYNPEIKQTLDVHVADTFKFKAAVHCTKFSCDGNYLAVGLGNGEIHVHNMITGSKSILVERSATIFYTEEAKTPPEISVVRFSPDNKYIATGEKKGQINIWEISRRRVRAIFKHKDLVRSLDFSPDGRFLVSASFDQSLCMWRIRDGSRRISWHGSFRFASVAFSPDGRSVAAGNDDGILRIYDARTGRLVTRWTIADHALFNLKAVVFSPDGKRIASGYKILRCWDFSPLTGRRHRIQDDAISQIFEFKGHKDAITAITFNSSDNLWVLSSSWDHNISWMHEPDPGCVH